MKHENNDDKETQDSINQQQDQNVDYKSIIIPDNVWVAWPNYSSMDPNSNLFALNQNYIPSSEKESQAAAGSQGGKKKRGRRPLRPFDPIKKKTEEKDKYWLRSFRSYMKFNYPNIESTLTDEEKDFWLDHLGGNGKPDKGNRFLSYGKKYKDYLFSHQTFVEQFQSWFSNYGQCELVKKCKPETDLWFVYYDYASKELYNYTPQKEKIPEQQLSEVENIEKTQEQILEEMMRFYMSMGWAYANFPLENQNKKML
ncbi:unnamed protein product [Blepharisma stoltei]|uniref:Uncharacterized protein n=1 Tax=Blepharisma stoltei TaxID=1481888 RepID=A0AAU9KAN8_9CILI|nr:unnamed protein product [Blepharisma stoltei]